MKIVIALLALTALTGTALAQNQGKMQGKAPVKASKKMECASCKKAGKECAKCKAAHAMGKKMECASCKKAGKECAKCKAAHAKAAKTGTKRVMVDVCPIMGSKVEGAGSGSSIVDNYEVKFCCGGCKPAFDKMDKKEQLAKIKMALAKS
jgi:hypothetical protein